MKQILGMLQPSPLKGNLIPRLLAQRGLQKRLQAHTPVEENMDSWSEANPWSPM
jgi:hypothetical protein